METPAGIMVACSGVRYEWLPDRFYLNEPGQNCSTVDIISTSLGVKDSSKLVPETNSSFSSSSSSEYCSSSNNSSCSHGSIDANRCSSMKCYKDSAKRAAGSIGCSSNDSSSSSSNSNSNSSISSNINSNGGGSNDSTDKSRSLRNDLEFDDSSCDSKCVPSPYFSRAALVEAVVASGTLQAAILQTLVTCTLKQV